MIQFKDENLEKQVEQRRDERTSANLVAKRDLERYYWLIAQDQIDLEISEFKLLCDASNGVAYTEPWSLSLLPDGVHDAIVLEELDKKWSVNADALILKLRNASVTQLVCLVDRIERFWVKRSEENDRRG